MSIGADPQMTLRDYFSRHGGVEHCLVVNILNDAIEFYVRPDTMKEADGMHFRLSMNGQITEVGAWEQTQKECEAAQVVEHTRVAREKVIDDANGDK